MKQYEMDYYHTGGEVEEEYTQLQIRNINLNPKYVGSWNIGEYSKGEYGSIKILITTKPKWLHRGRYRMV